MELDPADLPGALVEDAFQPTDVVVLDDDDGSRHVLMYVGKVDDGYTFLKHAILTPEQLALLRITPDSPEEAQESTRVPEEVWRIPSEIQRAPLLGAAETTTGGW